MSVTPKRGMTRRSFLVSAAAMAGGIGAATYTWYRFSESTPSSLGIIEGEPLALAPGGTLLDTDFPDPFAQGQFVGYLPFRSREEDQAAPLYQNSHGGHDARLCIDLASLLTPEGRLTPADKFFIRTEYPDLLRAPADWKIKVHGEVKQEQNVSLKSLKDSVESRGPVLLECSGNGAVLKNGLLSVADWSGIPIEKVIKLAQPTTKAKAIYINGFDDDTHLPDHGPPYRTHSYPTCSWIFPIETLVTAGAFLATEMNKAPLPKDHGAPVRLIIPNWFGCSEVKWVNEIKFVDNDQKATWQMREFSTRTGQVTHPVRGFYHPMGPEMARDYRPATIDQAAIPVRVELWKLDGKMAYRIVGITWGGPHRSEKLKIRFILLGKNGRSVSGWEPVQFCKAATSISQYGIWTHTFTPPRTGPYMIQVRLEDGSIPARRLKEGTYDRGVLIPLV